MHIHRAAISTPFPTTPWPAISFGTQRLWDAGVIWPALEPKKGQWHFEKLDANVTLAEAHNVQILLTLGQSPTWASARPLEPSSYGPGAAAEPANIEDWKNYIRTVATRYKGRIRYYEIWNEADLLKYYSGTVDQMVRLAQEAYATIKEVDPTVKLVSPSGSAHGFPIPWLEQYLIKGGATYADVIGYHFYVVPGPPEAMVSTIRNVRQTMTNYGISNKALWNTEAGWAKPKVFSSDSEASAYVARSYILNWAAGIDRFYWYAWDNHTWVTLEMTEPDSATLKPAGIAYAEVQKWIVGAKVLSCDQDAQGTWLAHITRGNDYNGFIVWNPDKTVNFAIPKEWNVKQMKDLKGSTTNITGTSQLNIGIAPALLENALGRAPVTPPLNHRMRN
jgi:hypothetical protein